MASQSRLKPRLCGGGGFPAARRCRCTIVASLLAVLARPASSLSSPSSLPRRAPEADARPPPSLASRLSGQMILAPLTRAGNLPYRRLCADFGCDVGLGEMVYARSLLKGDPVERARLRRAPNEGTFGVQIATNDVEEGLGAIKLAAESGADFVDLNCGCPIYEATRRGLGSALLRSPDRLGRLVGGLASGAAEVGIPLTVKIRLGCEADTINVREVVRAAREAGAAAVTVHGRTAQQRYSKSADWDLIGRVVADARDEKSDVPIIGNGDILTHYEAAARMRESGVDAVMVGRGALIKPWIFKEFKDGREWYPTMEERISVYRTLACYMKDHFGDDAKGRKKSWYFLPWHFEFLCRYMPLPEAEYGASGAAADSDSSSPLIQRRLVPDQQTPLDVLMSHRSGDAHKLIAAKLWESDSDAHAVSVLNALAESPEFARIRENAAGEGDGADDEDEELANIPDESRKRRGRTPKPIRSPEEIAEIRAERAAKKARLAALEGAAASGVEDGSPLTCQPLRNHPGVLKRWVSSGRAGQFGYIGVPGTKTEYFCHESALLPENDGDASDAAALVLAENLPLPVIFDTELTGDDGDSSSKSEHRVTNVRFVEIQTR